MRRIGRLVLPDGGRCDLGPGVVPVVQQGDQLRVDVLRQHIGVRAHKVAAADLILDAQHQPGFRHGEGGGHVQVLPHQGDQPGGGEAGPLQQGGRQLGGGQLVQKPAGLLGIRQLLVRQNVIGGIFHIAVLVRGLQQSGVLQQIGPQGLRRAVQILQVGEEAAAGCAVQGVQGIGKGGGAGDGQGVHPVDAPLLTQLQQPQDGLVGVLVLVQKRGVKGQIIGRAAGHHQLPVAVGDVATGGLHRL